MLFAPYNTDAPIYHPPIATGVIIAMNVVAFFGTTFQFLIGNMDESTWEMLILQFDRINPIQWVTSAFMHIGFGHLLSNMLFLWAFGLVVEGKIGSLRFTGLYLLVATVQGAMIQLSMFLLGGESGALGASGAIFSLMAIALIWAPENEMDCFYWIAFIWYGTFEIRIFMLGMLFIALQILMLYLNDFSMSSEMLHMAGVVVGVPVGFFMLRQGMVDCEGWDLVSRSAFLQGIPLLKSPQQRAQQTRNEQVIEDPVAAALALDNPSRQPATRRRTQAATSATQASRATEPSRRAAAGRPRADQMPVESTTNSIADRAKRHPEFNGLAFQLRQAIQTNNTAAAQQAFLRMDQKKIAIGLSDQLLFQYVSLLGKSQKWIDAIRPLWLVAEHDGPKVNDALLRIAQVQLRVLNNPTAAVRTLSRFKPLSPTPTDQERAKHQKREQLLAAARSDLGQA